MATQEGLELLGQLLTHVHMIEDSVGNLAAELQLELRRTRIKKKDIQRHQKSLEAILAAIRDLQELTVSVSQTFRTKSTKQRKGKANVPSLSILG